MTRTPPYNEEAERAIIGSLMLDSSRVFDICSKYGITEESFFIKPMKTIYKVCHEMMTANKPCDLTTITTALRFKGVLEAVGGIVGLEAVLSDTLTVAHAEGYITAVRIEHRKRDLILIATDTIRKLYANNADPDVIQADVESKLMLINPHLNKQEDWSESVVKACKRIENIIDGNETPGLMTGLRDLDDLINGFKPAEMTILAARPSVGKTALSMNMAEHIADDGSKVGIFSCEMSTEALATRMLCSKAGRSSYYYEKGFHVSQEERAKLTDASKIVGESNIVVDDSSGLDIDDLRARARRWARDGLLKLIIVDYLQLLMCRSARGNGRQNEVTAIADGLKGMAKELKIPVLILSQLKRLDETRQGKPQLPDLRDSGSLEQIADIVLFLRRPCRIEGHSEHEFADLAYAEVAKNRNGPVGEIALTFTEGLTKFSDRIEEEEEI